jgi:pimeloyl-ACP methyl ester carboxylesterase
MLAAQAASTEISALVMFGFAFDPSLQFGDPDVPARPARTRNTAEGAASDFISPRVTPPTVVRAFVDQALRADPILVDVRNDTEFNALAPRRVVVPTLVLFGERDPAYVPDDVQKFVRALGARDKTLVVLPGGDHAAQLEDTHQRWIDAVAAFVVRRPPA